MKRSRTLLIAILVVVLAAGFVVVSGRAAALGVHLPASLAKIFASGTPSTAPAPVATGAQAKKPKAPLVDSIIAGWDFTGAAAPATFAATTFNANLVSTAGANNITRGATAAASAGANSFRTVGFQNNGISTANTDYFQITLGATAGNKVSLSAIDAFYAGTASYAVSPGVSCQYAYSLDGSTFTLIGSPSTTIGTPATQTQINLTGISALQNVASGTTITIRYYASGQTTTGGWGFTSSASGVNGLAITGSTAAVGGTPTKLAITNISPASPTAGSGFNVTVQSQDGSNVAQNVTLATGFTLTTNGNAGTIGGTTTGTINAGSNQAVVTGVTLSSAGTGVTLTATRTSGDTLTPGTSAPFTVVSGGASEPTVQASAVNFTAVGQNSMTVNWTNGNGTNRIVLVKQVTAVDSNPVDGTSYTANTAYSSGSQIGSGNYVVFNGTGNSVTVTNLAGGTVYQFAVYEFNGSGGTQNYLTTAPATGSQATTTATYSWIGGSGDWQVAANWSPTRSIPATTDILQFNGGGTITVTNVPAQTIGQLSVSNSTLLTLQASGANTLNITGNTGTDLSVASGTALNVSGSNVLTIAVTTGATGSISGSMTYAGAAHKLTSPDASGITFQTGGSFTTGTGFSSNAFGTTNLNSVVFANGSTYTQNAGSNPFGATAPNSVVVFQAGSLYKHQTSGAPSFDGRTYANFEYNLAATITSGGGSGTVTMNDFTVTAGTFNIATTGTANINGTVTIVSGATFGLTGASGTCNVGGNFSNAGTFNPGTVTLVFNGASNTQTISGNITFNSITVNHTGTGSVIATAGTIALTGLLRVQLGTYTSSGTVINDYTNVQIDPAGTMSLTADIRVVGNWTNNGTFSAGSALVTFESANTTQTISGNSTFFNLTINHLGTGSVTAAGSTLAVLGLLRVQAGTFTSASNYTDVTIDGAGTLSLSGAITVSGNWTNNGTFNANGFGVTFDGNTAQSISGSTASAFAGLTISNTGNTVTLNQNASDTSLAVTSGTFSQAGTSNLTSGAVTVSSGATWSNLAQGDVTLSGDVSNAGTITFNANGATCGEADDILVRSSVNGTRRGWSGAGTFNMTDVDVKDQKAPALTPPPVAIVVTSGTDSGNNSGWAFSGTCTAGTYIWVGTVNSDWQVPANWSPTRAVPAPGDILILDGTATPGPIITNVPTQTIAALRLINGVMATLNASAVAPPQTLTVSGATGMDLTIPTTDQLTLAGANGLTINVASGSTATIGGLFLMQDGPHRLIGNAANAVTFQSGSICTTAPSYSSSVNPFGPGGGGANGATGSVIFESGSLYTHNNGESPFGIVANPPVAVFQSGSVARHYSNNGFQGRTYSTLIVGDGTTPLTITSSSSDPFEFDSLTVNSSNTANTSLTVSVGGNVNIKGDITSTGVGTGAAVSDVTLLSSTNIVIAKTPAGTINFNNTGGSVRTVSFGNATANSGNATVVTGNTLALARKLIVDTGSVITVNGALTGSATGYVIGKEKRPYTGAELFVYHVGTASGYSPLDANVTAAVGASDLTTEAKQPNQPVLNPATSLQRYWTLTEGGDITADLTFHYNQADVAGSEPNYRLVIVEGGTATQFPENCPDVACVDETANTIRRTGVTTFSDWTAAEPNAPTAVKLTSFTALRNNGEVRLNWQTGYEAHNLGYNIYREQDGKRVQITPSLVAGSALIAGRQTRLTAGLNYTWYDQPGAKGNGEGVKGTQNSAVGGQQSPVTYWLEDVDLNGTRTLHGPIAPAISFRKPVRGELRTNTLNEVSRRSGSAGVQFSGGPTATVSPEGAPNRSSALVDPEDLATQREIQGKPGVKIAVSKEGWYRITQPELLEAGLDPDTDASHLQLYLNGRALPIKQSGGARLNPSDYIEFYGQGIDSTTAVAQTYYLVAIDSAGSRMRDPLPQSLEAPPSGPTSFAYTVERKERMIYFSGLLNGDNENFFGQIVSTGETSATLPASHVETSTPAQLEIALQGVSSQSHLVKVLFNGVAVGTMNFANTEHAVQTFAVSGADLREGDNTVELTSLDGAADVSLVDVMRLTYGHQYIADDNHLELVVSDSQTKRFGGFDNPNIRVIDVTTPTRIKELTPTARVDAQDDGSFAVDVQVSGATEFKLHQVLVFAEERPNTVDSLSRNIPSSWSSETAGADYLVITTRDLKASVEPLAQLRRNQGMVVQVIDVEDLYDEFSFGEHSPRAVRDFLEMAANNWTRKPHYLLLAGDASFDPKNYSGLGLNDLVPTKLVDTALTESASDDWLADLNSDGIADIAIGRLPVRTVTEADAMVGKIVNYENAAPDPARGALLVADNSFEGPSSAVQSQLPAGMAVQTINRSSADDATVRNQILTSINQGPLVTNFVGHGSNGVWTGAALLSSLDAPSLTNTNRLSVFTMMTCFNGYFQDAYNDSLSEALLKAPGGAVAVWASTTLTEPAGQNAIDREFYRLLFAAQPLTLGDAARAAKLVTTDADVRRTWTLLGDPAMRPH